MPQISSKKNSRMNFTDLLEKSGGCIGREQSFILIISFVCNSFILFTKPQDSTLTLPLIHLFRNITVLQSSYLFIAPNRVQYCQERIFGEFFVSHQLVGFYAVPKEISLNTYGMCLKNLFLFSKAKSHFFGITKILVSIQLSSLRDSGASDLHILLKKWRKYFITLDNVTSKYQFCKKKSVKS